MKVILSIAFTEIQFGILIQNLKCYGVDILYNLRKTLVMA